MSGRLTRIRLRVVRVGSNPTPCAFLRLVFLILRTDDGFSLTIWVRFPACLENVKIWRVKHSKGCLAQWQRIALMIGAWSGSDSRRHQIFPHNS